MPFPVVEQALLQIRRRADMENSLFVDDSEIVELANDNLEIIYNTCVHAYGESVFCRSAIIGPLPATGTNSAPAVWPNMTFGAGSPLPTRYDLPTDFQSLIRAEWCQGTLITRTDGTGESYIMTQPNVRWAPMHPFDISGAVYDSTPGDWQQGQVAYWITSSPTFPGAAQDIGESLGLGDFQIAFLPVPKGVVTVHIQYLPKAPKIDAGYGVRLPELCWRYVREATAADMLEKQRSDSSVLRSNAEKYRIDVINTPLSPDDANPPQTIDVYGGSGLPPYGERRQVW